VRTDQVGVYAGAMQAYVADPSRQTYNASIRVVTDARFFVLRAEDFAWMMQAWFPMAIHLLEGLFLGMRSAAHIVGQRERLLALGALSAGLTHELNNPAAAAMRATASLRDRVAGMRQKLAMLAKEEVDPGLLGLLVDVQEEAVRAVPEAPKLTALEESEREDALNDWLDEHEVPDGWELAPIFVGAGTTPEFLDRLADRAPPAMLEGALRWLAYTLETELLMNEITDSVTRISTLVAAAKQYSNMDRAPHERVDVHAGLKSTLVMLASKLEGIEVVKDFDRSLPKVPVYAGELNQVWTNLIDNAVQAMDGHGTLTVSRSSPPSRSARAPGSAWTSPTGSWSGGTAAT
jgi:signal transduction histidine kinase